MTGLIIEHAISLDGTRARRVLGFRPSRPKVEVEELKRIVKEFQDDGIWYVYCQIHIADRQASSLICVT